MIERGTRNPTLDAAAKIAVALDMSLPSLISEAVGEIPAMKGKRNGS
jgi:transcriptional regulator with XRE-family HTH domain